MRKTIFFFLLVSLFVLPGCSFQENNNLQLNTPTTSTSSVVDQSQNEIENSETNLTKELAENQSEPQLDSSKSNFKTYSNVELGLSFNYPNEWPEPILIKKQYSAGSYFDNNDQWEIQLGELHENSFEGADKYFASIRGFYLQNKEEVISEIKNDKNKNLLWLNDQFENQEGSFIVYDEAGIVGVKNIMYFGNNGKTVKVQSIDDSLNDDIYSVALSLRFLK